MPRKVTYTDRLMRPIAHFSHAARVGNTVHIGATAGVHPDLTLAGESPGRIDVAAQVRKMFDNLETALGLMGATLSDVVRIKTYVAFPRDIAIYRPIYEDRFSSIRPVHTVIGSWDFPLPQAAIELDAVAVTGSGNIKVNVPDLQPAADDVMAGVIADGFHYASVLPVETAPDFRQQAAAALRNLRETLASAELSPRDICYLHLTLRDIRESAELGPLLQGFFGNRLPACTIVGAPLAQPDFSISIESIATRGGGEVIDTRAAPLLPGGPAPAVRVGDVLFLGGQIGLSDDTHAIVGIKEQTEVAWARLHSLVAAAGFSDDSIIRTNNVLSDWRDYAGFNAGYGNNMREPYVPRATVLGCIGTLGARVQIEGIAHRHGADATILQVAPPAAG